MKRFSWQWHKGVFPGTIFAVLLVLLMAVVLGGCKQEGEAPEPGHEAEEAKPAAVEGKIADIKCAECHEMWPEIATWMVSSHSQIACEKCHTKVDLARMENSKKIGNFSKPIKIREKIPGDTCKQCHSSNRAFSLSGDLIVPHDRHDKARVGCTDCHNTVVHAAIAERAVTTRPGYTKYADWTPELAKKVATRPFQRPSMWVCIDCHDVAKVDTPCADCHKVYTSLPSHERPDWLSAHGREGRKNPSNCSMCHANKEGPKTIDSGTGDEIIDFERATPYCYNCHLKRPAFHGQNYMSQHAAGARAKGLLNCFACHSIEAPKTPQNVTGTYCNNCHWFPVKKMQAKQTEEKPESQE
ncbi:MAG: cytochrome c3 family protein [Bacillota bacterium]